MRYWLASVLLVPALLLTGCQLDKQGLSLNSLGKPKAQEVTAHADALRRSGDYEGALKEYHALLKRNITSPEVTEGIGLTYLGQGKYKEATATLMQVLEVDALRWKALNGLGVANIQLGKPAQAVDFLSTAYDVSAEPVVLHNLGLAYAAQRQYPPAILQLQRAVSAFQVKQEAEKAKRSQLNLALVQGLSGNFDAAKELLKPHLSEDKIYHELSMYAHLAQDNDLAYAYIQKSLSTAPDIHEKSWELAEKLRPLMSGE